MKRLVVLLCMMLVPVGAWAEVPSVNVYPFDTKSRPDDGSIQEEIYGISVGSEPFGLAVGKTPDGNWAPIQVDKDGYVKVSPCHNKMREAMKHMNEAMLRGHMDGNATYWSVTHLWMAEHWRPVMKECVQ